jgi:hypothetical protein
VTTSKLLARKRPRLLPVIDSVVKEMLKHPAKASFWLTLCAQLNADGGRLNDHLLAVREEAGFSSISVIRCFDVVVWMIGKRERVGDIRGRYYTCPPSLPVLYHSFAGNGQCVGDPQ